jgi:hypothetical protein
LISENFGYRCYFGFIQFLVALNQINELLTDSQALILGFSFLKIFNLNLENKFFLVYFIFASIDSLPLQYKEVFPSNYLVRY